MTAPDRLDLVSFAQQLLVDVPAAFAAGGNALPERRVIIPGDPLQHAWDCQQFTIGLTGVGWGQAEDLGSPSPRAGSPFSVMAMRHVVLALQIVRCAPTGGMTGIPAADDIHAAGVQQLRDAGMLSQTLVEIVKNLGGAPHAQAGAINPDAASGGFYGITGSVSITSGDLA